MKKVLWFFVLLLFSLVGRTQIDQWRILFFSANTPEGKKSLYDATRNIELTSSESKAYQGVATAMYADLVESVSEKLNSFNTGKNLLEEAVKADWYNAEVRFLRFSVQAEVPFFLGYSGNKEDDAAVVLDALYKARIDYKSDFWKKALRYMVESDELSNETTEALRKYIV